MMSRSSLLAAVAAVSLSATAAHAADPLVSTNWLADALGQDDLVVLDIRNRIDGGSRDVFEQGHIPGAVYSSYTDAGWRIVKDGVPGMMPPVADLESLIGGLGIDSDDHVVIVPAGLHSTDFGAATRIYWTFKVLGHDDVSILDGGYRAWTADERPIASGPDAPVATTYAADYQADLVASEAEVQAALANGQTLIDARPEAQFTGASKSGAVARYGTVPGSFNVPQTNFYSDTDGHYATLEALTSLFDAKGVDDGEDDIVFCNTGHWASLAWFASSEILGRKDTKLYDGSMSEWSADDANPMITTE